MPAPLTRTESLVADFIRSRGGDWVSCCDILGAIFTARHTRSNVKVNVYRAVRKGALIVSDRPGPHSRGYRWAGPDTKFAGPGPLGQPGEGGDASRGVVPVHFSRFIHAPSRPTPHEWLHNLRFEGGDYALRDGADLFHDGEMPRA